METTITSRAVDEAYRLAALARQTGVCAEQLNNFLRAVYALQQKQLAFHAAARECDLPDGPSYVGFGGARGPGKSHAVFSQIALDDCQRFKNLKVLYLRKISKNAREQFEDLRRKILWAVPHDYNRSTGVLTFPRSDSRIVLGHFRTEGDIDQYLGIEYDIIAVEEATTLTKPKWDALRDSNRTSKEGFRPRMYSSTNPGGVGHAWYRALFIDPARKGQETETRFIFATVEDNRFIDPGYKKKLEKNTGWRLRAYRYGDWDIAAGQYFITFNYDLHTIGATFIPNPLPDNWQVWCALDYGFTHPTVVYLFAKHDGITYVVDEHYEAKRLVPYHSQNIKEMLARSGVELHRLSKFVAGADCFAKQGDREGKTIAEQYADEGIYLKPANTARIGGATHILEALGDEERDIPATVKISRRCVKLIECLPAMQHDPNRPEDVLKIDVDEDGNGGDDPYDAFRYGINTKESIGVHF